MRRGRGLPQIMVVDFLAALVLLLFALVKLATYQPAAVKTAGVYAVVVSWPGARNDDVDSYVQDPAGEIVYFSNPSAGLMHLEHDDLGRRISGNQSFHGETRRATGPNEERVILRGTLPGEYVANVHLYRKAGLAPVPVTVTLWTLRGRDSQVTTTRLLLQREGDEKTAFRFTLDQAGAVTSTSHRPKHFVQGSWAARPNFGGSP